MPATDDPDATETDEFSASESPGELEAGYTVVEDADWRDGGCQLGESYACPVFMLQSGPGERKGGYTAAEGDWSDGGRRLRE